MPMRKLSYLLLLALTSQGVLANPTIEAVERPMFQSRLNKYEEGLASPSQSDSYLSRKQVVLSLEDEVASATEETETNKSDATSAESSESAESVATDESEESANSSQISDETEQESVASETSDSNQSDSNSAKREASTNSESKREGLISKESTSQASTNEAESPQMASDSSLSEELTPDEEAAAKAFRDEQRINDFVKALGNLETLEHYQIHYKLTDTQTDETVAEGQFAGNQSDGDLMGRLAYYFPDASPQQYDYEFISYRHFDLAYVKTFELLDSMAFFNQPYFNLEVHEKIADLKDKFVAIESSELNRVNLQRDPFKTLLMLPDLNRLSRISADRLYQVNDLYLLSLERLEIPEYLFRHSNNFGFDFHLGMDILPADDTDTHINWNVNSEQRFEISERDNSLNFKVAVDSDLSDFMLPQAPEGVERTNEDFSRQMSLDNDVMLDKLTKVNMVYNSATQSYRISLVGIVEQIEFNLFSDEAAGLETTEYRLDYTLKPIETEIPRLDELDKMTASEADYLLEEFLNP